MLSGEGNENGEKTTIGLISKKQFYCTCSALFCTFLCRCFARLPRETSRNFLVTRFMKEMSYMFLFTFFIVALFLAEPRWPVALLPLFLCLSLSLFSKFVDMTISLNLMLSTTRIQKYFPLSVFVFIDSLVVSASQDAGGHTLSRQNNLTFGIGLHELDVRISLINTHRHTVLKKYRLKYLILPGNSQGQGKIPGNPKKNIQKCSYTPPPPK